MCELDDCAATPRRSFLQRATAALALISVDAGSWARAAERGRMVDFPTSVGQGRGYLALPEGKQTRPAVLVLHGEIGLPSAHKLTADELASAGFAALAIERFSRLPGFDWKAMQEDNRGPRKYLTEAFAREEEKEALGALAFLRRHPAVRKNRLGAVGFCGGGIRAVRLGMGKSSIAAVVSFYGPPVLPPQYKAPKDPLIDLVEMAGKVRTPLQMHYGTNDYAVKGDDVERLAALARRSGAEVETFAYPDATHAFYDRTNREAFAPEAADLARTRYFEFLHRHLDG